MPELTIKYKNVRTLQALTDLARYFDFVIEQPVQNLKAKGKSKLPIDFADNPDLSALAGIWKEKEITLDELRKKAWVDRL